MTWCFPDGKQDLSVKLIDIFYGSYKPPCSESLLKVKAGWWALYKDLLDRSDH